MEETLLAQHQADLLDPSKTSSADGVNPASSSDENNSNKDNKIEAVEQLFVSRFGDFGSLFDTVKKQSVLLGELAKKDLNELYSTVTEESHNALGTISNGMQSINLDLIKSNVVKAEAAIEAVVNTDKAAIVKRIGGFSELMKSAIKAASDAAVATTTLIAGEYENTSGSSVHYVSAKQQLQDNRSSQDFSISILFERLLGRKELYLLDPITPTHPHLQSLSSSSPNDDKDKVPLDTTEDSVNRFEVYNQKFDLNEYTSLSERILKDHTAVRTCWEELVPSVESNNMFWLRFFWHLNEFKASEERKKKQLDDAMKVTYENDFSWDVSEITSTPSSPSIVPDQAIVTQEQSVDPQSTPSEIQMVTSALPEATGLSPGLSTESCRISTEGEFDIVTDGSEHSPLHGVVSDTTTGPALSRPSSAIESSAGVESEPTTDSSTTAPSITVAAVPPPAPHTNVEDDWGEWS